MSEENGCCRLDASAGALERMIVAVRQKGEKMHTGVIYYCLCVILVFAMLVFLESKGRYDHGYNDGWADCEDIHNKYENFCKF